jgi:AraC family transcriptional regulator, positive regulator of tynA and feaB
MNDRLSFDQYFEPAEPAESAPMAAQVVDPPGPSSAAVQAAPPELVFKNRDAWQAGLRRFVLPLECGVADPQSFRCNAVVGRLRGNAVAELRVDASRLVRRAVHLIEAECELVKIVWLLAGRGRVSQGPNNATIQAGGWSVLDPGREYAIELDKGSRILMFLVPRSQCPGWLPALNALSARALHAGGPAHIAAACLSAMLRDVVPLDAESEGTLHESVVALIERALAIELGARGLAAQSERSIHLTHVQAYIREHLADFSLTVGRLATVFGASRRNLYNIFNPSGVTPHVFIQSARLDHACALLTHPASRSGSVAGVARQCGFSDPAHFSRAFHARHGVAPTAWRERTR